MLRRSEIRSRKARSQRALQRERQRKRNFKRKRERESERDIQREKENARDGALTLQKRALRARCAERMTEK